jgi:hypothetical protein
MMQSPPIIIHLNIHLFVKRIPTREFKKATDGKIYSELILY